MGLAVIGAAIISGAIAWWFYGAVAGIIMFGLTLLAGLLAPKPKSLVRKPATLSDFQVTQVEEGTPIPIVYGLVKIPSTLIWYGNLKVEEVEEEVGGKKGGSATVGYKYWLDEWHALCHGKIKILHFFEDNDMGKVPEYKYYLFNDGTTNVYPSELNLEYASPLKGIAHIFFKRHYLGMNRTFVPVIYFIVKRVLSTGLPYENGTSDFQGNNPAAIVYDLLTNFAGISSEFIDISSFQSAASFYASKNWYMSYVISSQKNLTEVISEILGTVDSFLIVTSEGKLAIKIMKREDTATDTIEDDFIDFEVVKPSYDSIPNCFTANYTYIETEGNKIKTFEIRSVIWNNIANFELIKMRNKKDIDLTFFNDYNVVLERLTSIGKKESFPRISLRIRVPIRYSYLNIGDLVTIKNSDLGISADFRIMSISEPKLDSNEIEMVLLQHTEKFLDESFRYIEPPYWEEPVFTLIPFSKVRVIEIKYPIEGIFEPTFVVLVNRETSYETGFVIYISTDGTTYSPLKLCTTFSTFGTLDSLYPITYEIDDETGLIFTPYKMFEEYSNLTRKELFQFTRFLLVNNEIMTFQNISPYGSSSYKLTGIVRGLFWTVISSHSSGSPLWITKIGNNWFRFSQTSTFYVKVVPIREDRVGDLSQATTITVNSSYSVPSPETPSRIRAVRSGNDVSFDVYAITKEKLGAGYINADACTDSYPFDVEGSFKIVIGTDTYFFNTPHFTITKSGSFTANIYHFARGNYSLVKSISIGSSDGEYIA